MRISLSVVALTAALTAAAGPLNETDRGRILSELQISSNQFLDSIANLTPEQWTYKAGPDRWSIAEVSEHIVAAEELLRTLVTERVLKGPADTGKAEQRAPNNAKIDERLLIQLRDRRQKATAPGELVPKGIYKSPQEAAEAFKAARGTTVEYVKTTQADLRDHFYSPFPGAELDAAQGLLFIAGHSERHTEQIEEVKQSPGYPKK